MEEFLQAAMNLEVKRRSHLNKYRNAIIILRFFKKYSQREICEFFTGHNISIKRATLSLYLRRHPPTKEELNILKTRILTNENNNQSKVNLYQKVQNRTDSH